MEQELEKLATIIVNASFNVHKKLGPGLLEKVYETCLIHELKKAGLKIKSQVPVQINYDEIQFDEGFRLDILVEDKVIIEIKAVEKLHDVYEAQLLSYLKLTNLRLGFLINFKVRLFKNGITRFAN